jgi:hypothetical protein
MKEKLLITVEIDALEAEHVNNRDMPFLYSLAKRYYTSRIATSLTFTQFVEVFAGLRPQESGIWTMFKKGDKSVYGWTKMVRPLFDLTKILGMESLNTKVIDVLTNLRLLLRGKTYFATKSRIPIRYLHNFTWFSKDSISKEGILTGRKTIFDELSDANMDYAFISLPYIRSGNSSRICSKDSDEYAVKKAIEVFRKKRLRYIHIYLKGVDSITHKHGLDSPIVKAKRREIDSILERLYRSIKKGNENAGFMFFSYHGMVKVRGELNIKAELDKANIVEGKDYLGFYESTIARFWCTEMVGKRIKEALKYVKGGRVLSDKDRKKFGIDFSSNEYGDVFFLAEPGILLLPNYFQGERGVVAMHTYEPIRELDGMLVDETKKGNGMFEKREDLLNLYSMIRKRLGL